jgi:tripartite-type tricarboxylate transporter receptor subunit TctC
MMFAPIVVALPHIQSGAVRGLSITSADRSPLLPELRTVREAGLPEAETEVWIACSRQRAPQGSDVVIDASPAAFSRFVDEEIATWEKVVRQSGVTIE